MGKFQKLTDTLPPRYDALLLVTRENQRYASGFDFQDGYVLVTRQGTYILCDARYAEASSRIKGVTSVALGEDTLRELCSAHNVSTLGYEDDGVTAAKLRSLKKQLGAITLYPAGAFIRSAREYKDSDEIESIKQAQRIADEAFEHILKFIKPEMTETEVALELEFYMRRHGAEAAAFDTICISGESSSLPHGVPLAARLRPGFLTMDYGAVYRGYRSDMTRTVVIGAADAEMKRVYATVLRAQSLALERMRPGVRCAEVDEAARSCIDELYPGAFVHSLGHGVGLDVHEAPTLSRRAGDRVLSAGHVVTVEPGIYLRGKYGCRIEDMVVFYTDRYENITASPKNLIEIC